MSRNTRSRNSLQEKKRKDPNANLFNDTSGCVSRTIHLDWSRIYSIFDNGKFSTIPHDQLAYATNRSSQLHCIADRPPFMPYTKPFKWELDHAIPKDRSFDDHTHTQLASFHPDVFARTYALKPPQHLLSSKFLDEAMS